MPGGARRLVSRSPSAGRTRLVCRRLPAILLLLLLLLVLAAASGRAGKASNPRRMNAPLNSARGSITWPKGAKAHSSSC
eukprot:3778114-Alexandrium_andersonii.AAC.1